MTKTLIEHEASLSTLPYEEVTLDDFLTGLLASIADLGFRSISMKTSLFYRATAEALAQFKQDASSSDLPVDFDIEVNRFRGGCPPLRAGITRAVQRDLISLDNPIFLTIRLKIDAGDGDRFLNRVPGDANWYRHAAEAFVNAFRGLTMA